jgi:organic radical activating enzyme
MREEIQMLSPEAIAARIPLAPLLVITGGEPLLQQHREAEWSEFLGYCDDLFPMISVETNGTQLPNADSQAIIDQFVVSPKLSTVNMLRPHHRMERAPDPGWGLILAAGSAVDFKIVVSEEEDVHEAVRITKAAGIPLDRLWLMPEGTSKEALDARWGWVSEAAADLGCNASHRLHVLAWNDERGH